MALFGGDQSVSVLLKITGDSTSAVGALKDVEKGSQSAAGPEGIAGFNTAASASFGIISGLVTALTAAIGAYVLAAAKITALTLESAKLASEMADTARRTNLAASTLSALKFQAESNGSSFAQVTTAVSSFNTILGEAAEGNKNATKVLQQYHITATETDEALKQAIKTVSNMSSADEKAVAVKKLFKDETGKILPVIESLNGDLDATTAKLKEMGIVMDDEAVRKGDLLAKQLDTISAQAKGLAFQFSSELFPVFIEVFQGMSKWISENKGEVAAWGKEIADAVRGVGVAFQLVEQFAINALRSLSLGFLDAAGSAEVLRSAMSFLYDRTWLSNLATLGRSAPQGPLIGGLRGEIDLEGRSRPSTGGRRRGGGGGGKSNEAERKAKDELAAQINLLKLDLDDLEETFQRTLETAREEFKKTKDIAVFTDAVTEANRKLQESSAEVMTALDALELKQGKGGTPSQIKLIERRQQERREEMRQLSEDTLKDTKELTDAVAEQVKQATKAIFEQLRNDMAAVLDQAEADAKQFDESFVAREVERNKQIIEDVFSSPEQRNQAREAIGVLIQDLHASLNQYALIRRDRKLKELADEKALEEKHITDTIKNEEERLQALEALNLLYKERALGIETEYQQELQRIIDEYAVPVIPDPPDVSNWDLLLAKFEGNQAAIAGIEALQTAFEGLANAIGSAVQAWVLYGNSGTNARKVTAQILAAIAQQAVVKAIFHLAEGFAALALGNGASAALHFKAAALYGAVAAVAAVAGRAVAGNEFNGQANQATGSGGSAGDAAGDNPPLQFTEKFGGFQQRLNQRYMELEERSNAVFGGVTEALDKFTAKFEAVSAGHVVMAGAKDASGSIREAYEAELNDDPRAATDLYRKLGAYT